MNDFIIDIVNNSEFILDIESSSISGVISSIDSTATVESSDKQDSVFVIDIVSVSDFGNILIEKYDTYNLEIINTNGIVQYALPDNLTLESLAGNLHVSRIDGLDEYLDSYTFDCGTP
jgi:hypothetical protein